MDTQRIIKELKTQYPGKNIILNDPENPTEIICEIEPGSWDPMRSVAIAVMDENLKHYHRIAKEIYEVVRGKLEITKGGQTHILSEGEKLEIEPEQYHMAKGKETWVKVTSEPAWSPDDHYLAIEEGTKI
jgi:quercetin dioxygenase-like cupin family protein